METIQVHVKSIIFSPIEKVFQAIVDPAHLTHYFVSHASGKLAEGEMIQWNFEDVGVMCEVHVLAIVKNEKIHFTWNAIGQKGSEVVISLLAEKMTQTKIEITECDFDFSETGVQKALGQTQGWTDFICSMKAYLYAGVNLRNGQKTQIP